MSQPPRDWWADGRPLRTSPLVLWAMGPTAAVVAGKVLDAVPPVLREAGVVRPFAPSGDFRSGLTEVLADIAQDTGPRGRGAEVEVRLLVATWEVAEPLDRLLQEVSDLMARALSAGRGLALSLLVPPALATPAHAAQSWSTLQTVGRAMGRVPSFGSALVFQIDLDLYRQPDPSAKSLNRLSDALCRSIVDDDTGAVVRHQADPLIRNRRHCDGEPAGCSSLAACRVLYDREELLRYLRARFQRELFALALCDPTTLSPQSQAALRAQAAGLIDELRQMLTRHGGGAIGWEPPTIPSGDEPLDVELLREVVLRAVASGQILADARLAEPMAAIEQRLQAELDGLLDRSPQYLAGAEALLGLLGATPSQGEGGAAPESIAGLEGMFCRKPLRDAAVEWFDPRLKAALARYQVPPPASADPQTGCSDAASLLEIRIRAEEVAAQARQLTAAWDQVQTALGESTLTATGARDLIARVAEDFLTEAERTARRLAEYDQARDALREQGRTLRKTYPVYKFWLRFAYAEARRELEEQMEQLAEQREATLTDFDAAAKLFGELVRDLLWPHYRRAALMDGARQAYADVRARFDRFLDALRNTWNGEWEQARKLRELDRLPEMTVNRPDKGDLLYARILGTPNWPKLVEALLSYVPSLIERDGGDPPDYAACKTLRDHFHADPDLLTRRVADFATDRFKPARGLDILDIIELPGKDEAWKFLDRIDAALTAEPELASARIPRLLELGLCQRQASIRCTPTIQERLRRDYRTLFAGQDRFIDTADPCVLDTVGFTIGYPASVLHVLASAAVAPPAPPSPSGDTDEIILDTQRSGNHHSVSVTLEGEGDRRIQRTLMVDTGASSVSLPASLIPVLGIPEEALQPGKFETANGTVEGSVGMLPAVWLGGQRIPQVAASFIADDRLTGEGLLGMSVLGRFRFTIDDENSRLHLAKP